MKKWKVTFDDNSSVELLAYNLIGALLQVQLTDSLIKIERI